MNKLQTSIGIRFEVEGFHNYPDASKNHGELVKFLEQPHRHIFKFNCKKRVNHDNRDEEFILLRRKVKQYINRKFPVFESGCECYDFGSMSCEMIAKNILKQFDFDSVEVSEDGENYAVVEKVEVRDNSIEELNETSQSKINLPKIEFIVGEAFSGKTTYVNGIKQKNDGIVEVGDIVRKLTYSEMRTFDSNLSDLLCERICNMILLEWNLKSIDKIYIVGCRQQSLFDKIIDTLKRNCIKVDFTVTVLSVKEETRRKRFEKVSKEIKNTNYSFEDIEKGDAEIGLKDFIIHLVTAPELKDKVEIKFN
nr:MAG TPA: antibiotic resistance protein [Caudoviricetes sp.]